MMMSETYLSYSNSMVNSWTTHGLEDRVFITSTDYLYIV